MIGRRSKKVRSLYYRYSHGKWLWGIIGFIVDNPHNIKDNIADLPETEFDRIIEKIFKIV